MSKRTRIHPVQFYLNDDEQYILEEKYRLSRMKSKSAFLRKMILYGDRKSTRLNSSHSTSSRMPSSA